MLKLSITSEQIEALGVVLDLAHGDQEQWLKYGDPHVDYGAEWPEVANRKAKQFRAIANFAGPLIAGERERWEALANEMVSDAVEHSLRLDAALDRQERARRKADDHVGA